MFERGGSRGIVDLQAAVLTGVEFFTSVGLKRDLCFGRKVPPHGV